MTSKAGLQAQADALWACGRFREAAQLDKQATTLGDCFAAARLVSVLHAADPADQRPAAWAVEQVTLDNPAAVTSLLNTLRRVGADDQVAELLAREPAARVVLEFPLEDDAFAMETLLRCLRDAGADDQASALAARAAAHTRLDDPLRVAVLLDMLRTAGTSEDVAVLVARAPGARTAPDDYVAVAWLVELLSEAGAHDQAATLVERAVGHAVRAGAGSLARLLGDFCERDIQGYLAAVAEQAVADAPISDPAVVARLLTRLHEGGADDLITALVARDPARHAHLHRSRDVASLLDSLDRVGAEGQLRALAERAAPHSRVKQRNEPWLAGLFDALPPHVRPASAAQLPAALQTPTLVSEVPLDDPRLIAKLLGTLRSSWPSGNPLRILLARDPAAHVCIDDPESVVLLLNQLRLMRTHSQVTTLAERAAATTPISGERDAKELLKCLRIIGTQRQVDRFLERLPDAGHFKLFVQASDQPERWRFGRESDQPTDPWGWDDLG